MVWSCTNRLAATGSQACGTLLSDIASGKSSGCCKGNCNSVFALAQKISRNVEIDPMFDSMFLMGNGPSYSDMASAQGMDIDLMGGGSSYGLMPFLTGFAGTNDYPYSAILSLLLANSGNSGTQSYNATSVAPAGSVSASGNYNVAPTGSAGTFGNYTVSSSPLGGYANNLVNYASQWVGRINSDRQGNIQFSGGKERSWCADFVIYCMRQTLGRNCPSWFNSPRCYYLKENAKQNGHYIELPASNKAEFIANNVKPGDVMIQLQSNSHDSSGHTGIVESVNPDGSFVTIEGNSSDKVQRVTRRPNDVILRGFIRV